MKVYLEAVAFHLPEGRLTNDDLVKRNPTWDADSLLRKTGIRERRIAAPGETSLDLAEQACHHLFREMELDGDQIDAIICCTQTPDFLFPSTACLLHERLNLKTGVPAFDLSHGCAGFVASLLVAKSLVLAGVASRVLVVAADTLSKLCRPDDPVTAPIFGDGAGTAIVGNVPERAIFELGQCVIGADGKGASHLCVPGGAARSPEGPREVAMNGLEVFNFTLTHVTEAIGQLLTKMGRKATDVDRFLLHQANGFILETLRRKLDLTKEQLPIDLESIGNTSSASLPILLRRCLDSGAVSKSQNLVLAGFGVGFRWAVMELATAPGTPSS